MFDSIVNFLKAFYQTYVVNDVMKLWELGEYVPSVLHGFTVLFVVLVPILIVVFLADMIRIKWKHAK